jgi:hypothetical protein
MKKSAQEHLRDLFDTLETATVGGDSVGTPASVARKNVNCVEDWYAGLRCGG